MSVDIACDQKYVDMCNKRDMKLTEEMDEKIRLVAVNGTNITRSINETISVDNYQQTSALTVSNLKGTQLDKLPALGITGLSASVDDSYRLVLGIYINDKDSGSKWTCDIKTYLPFLEKETWDDFITNGWGAMQTSFHQLVERVMALESKTEELEEQVNTLQEELEGLINQ